MTTMPLRLRGPEDEDPPERVWRDGALAAAVVGTTTAEVLLRDDLAWPLLALALGSTLALAMLWRRRAPVAMAVLGFGSIAVVDLAAAVTGQRPVLLYAGASVVVLLYAMFRWAPGPRAALGSVVAVAAWAVAVTTQPTAVTDAAGGLVALLFPAALGLSFRYRHLVRAQQLDRVRSHERETLARELHDTVAHHVSAIAIQAQAGQVLARSRDLTGAADALGVIEQEASRTLTEMRTMVGALRHGDGPTQPPAPPGVADILGLATAEGVPGLRVDVDQVGDLGGLGPSVQAALYRVAQESVTNAQRHARHATRVRVSLAGDADVVTLGVSDDGDRVPSDPAAAGYGVVGMTERVTLLGGTVAAGPHPGGGWTVQARIPRHGRQA
ncbi:MAG: sensor histidine kinase [Nocardioidaceae bacterium]|nr:sensor histidine kinase [Nocardioidaceae bacterium]